MSINDSTPMSIDDNDVPFSGPNPEDDQANSTRPEADSDVDEQEYYDEGLSGAAEIDQDEDQDENSEEQVPDGFHTEE